MGVSSNEDVLALSISLRKASQAMVVWAIAWILVMFFAHYDKDRSTGHYSSPKILLAAIGLVLIAEIYAAVRFSKLIGARKELQVATWIWAWGFLALGWFGLLPFLFVAQQSKETLSEWNVRTRWGFPNSGDLNAVRGKLGIVSGRTSLAKAGRGRRK